MFYSITMGLLVGWVGASMCHSGTVADSQALSTTSTLSPPLQHY